MKHKKKRKIVIGYTAGVFDLFHIGHLNILRRAKRLCDRLIVGVSTDRLILKEKNKKPVIPFAERCEIVRSIRYVDLVCPQNTMDKFEAWKELKFDIIFVGDDWKGTARWNVLETQFANVGVQIVYFPYTKKTSSTLIKGILEEMTHQSSLARPSENEEYTKARV